MTSPRYLGRRAFAAIMLILAGALSGCATGIPVGGRRTHVKAKHATFLRPAAPRLIPAPDPQRDAAMALTMAIGSRERVVVTAKKLVGAKRIALGGKKYSSDCTGLVVALFEQVGMNLLEDVKPRDNAVTAIFRYAQRNGRVFHGGRPLPGDLVFFRETYDQNRDGRANDGLTHVGLVEDVDAAGTVTVIHRVSRGVVRYRMNLEAPAARIDSKGRVLNDQLRYAGPGRSELLTGQLFAAYATVLPTGSPLASR